MPNNVHNTVLVTGPNEDRVALLALVRGECAFDFNKVTPMPHSLNVIADSESESALAVAEFAKLGHSKGLTEMLSHPWVKNQGIKTEREMFDHLLKKSLAPLMFGNLLLDNIEKYGAPTWYEWALKNWGTKWNAYEVQDPEHNDRCTLFKFETASREPFPVLEELSKRFRRLKFAVSCYPDYDERYDYELKAGRAFECARLRRGWEGSEAEEALAVAECAKYGHSDRLAKILSYGWVKKKGIKTENEMYDFLLSPRVLAYGNILLDNLERRGVPYLVMPDELTAEELRLLRTHGKPNARQLMHNVKSGETIDKLTNTEGSGAWTSPTPHSPCQDKCGA